MKVRQIGDWALEDRLMVGGPPVVVMFLMTEGRNDRFARMDFRRVAENHPEINFYEIDLIENPSLMMKYQISFCPIVLIFSTGTEVARQAGPLLEPTIQRVLGPHPQKGAGL
jgi:hypothetical protein